RLGLVAVHDEVARPHAGGREAPLRAGREARAATAEQGRLLDLFRHLRRRHRERLAEPLVATRGVVALERVRVVVLEPRGDDLRPVTVVVVPRRPRIGGNDAHDGATSIQAGAVVACSTGTAPTALSAGIR